MSLKLKSSLACLASRSASVASVGRNTMDAAAIAAAASAATSEPSNVGSNFKRGPRKCFIFGLHPALVILV